MKTHNKDLEIKRCPKCRKQNTDFQQLNKQIIEKLNKSLPVNERFYKKSMKDMISEYFRKMINYFKSFNIFY